LNFEATEAYQWSSFKAPHLTSARAKLSLACVFEHTSIILFTLVELTRMLASINYTVLQNERAPKHSVLTLLCLVVRHLSSKTIRVNWAFCQLRRVGILPSSLLHRSNFSENRQQNDYRLQSNF